MKKHNFYAGPSILPEFTKEKTAEAASELCRNRTFCNGSFAP